MTARHFVLPEGIASTGWPAVRDTCASVGIGFDPWQAELNRALLAKDADGFYAADTAVISICRQSGKTYDVGGVTFAESIISPGTTTVWTAHRFKVARETFNQLRALATLPKMAPHVDPDAITTAAGNECIPFRNGSRIVFAARERGAIRGFSKVRRLVLDEAQILTDGGMADLAPTMNQAENPQIILMGTPPKPTDPGEVFSALRADALEGRSEGVLYVEYSADPDCDPNDWEAVAQANPSFPLRTSKRAIDRLRKLLVLEEDFAREALGIWAPTNSSVVVDLARWADMGDEGSQLTDPARFAVAVSQDRAWTTIAAAGRRDDDRRHVEVVERRTGTAWAAQRLQELSWKWKPGPVLLDASGPAGALIADLTARKVKWEPVSTREYAQACGAFVDHVAEGRLRHIRQDELDAAVAASRKRMVGDAWVWRRKDTTADVGPLEAVTLALFGHDERASKRPRPAGERRAVVL